MTEKDYDKYELTSIEKAFNTQSEKKMDQDPSAYFYPNLSTVQKERIQKVQEVLDRRLKEGKTLDQINLKVLFNPEHDDFEQMYAFEDLPKEELISVIRYRV